VATTTTTARKPPHHPKPKAKPLHPVLDLNPTLGPPGTIVSVTGHGFPKDKLVTISWSLSTGSDQVRTNAKGELSATLILLIPDILGPRLAEAKGYTAKASFLVVPNSSQPGGSDANPIFRTEGP
jgi:hypothetical protein